MRMGRYLLATLTKSSIRGITHLSSLSTYSRVRGVAAGQWGGEEEYTFLLQSEGSPSLSIFSNIYIYPYIPF